MNIKICGITNLADALLVANQGAWAIGFNFYKKSPRYIPPEEAKKICSHLPNSLMTVGVFVNNPYEEILSSMNFLDYAQLYQDDDSMPLDRKRVIRALSVSAFDELPPQTLLSEYAFVLLDAPALSDGLLGGTGRTANWSLAKIIARNRQLILAGGLNTENVSSAIQVVQPFAVDVASGVELSPGIKNHCAIKEFIWRSNYES